MDKLKVAVIGCGNISVMHLEAIAALRKYLIGIAA